MSFIDTKYFKQEDGYIVFTGPYMEAYIPSFYFTKGLALEVGETIKVFGLFTIKTFNDADGKNENPMRTVNIPTSFITYPSSFEVKQMDLIGSGEPEIYTILKYYNGDVFAPTKIPKDLGEFKKFLLVLTGGKVPSSTSYHDIINIWQENHKASGIGFDTSDTIQELIVAEIYRNKKNPVERFGKLLGTDPNYSPYDYATANVRQITKINSNFTGVTFEDVDTMLVAGVNRTNSNGSENVSPMEQIMKY